jgi:Xaa-Pro aminopeptidase
VITLPRKSNPAPSADHAERLRVCRASIQRRKLSGYLVTNRMDQFYLTGFAGEDGALLVLPRAVYVFTDGRFEEEAEHVAGWTRIVVRKGSLADAISSVVRRHRCDKVGYQSEWLTVELLSKLRRALRPTRLVALPGSLTRQRVCKSDNEVDAIREAIRVAEDAFKATMSKIHLGMKERELAARLQFEMVSRGASESSFPIIVAEGPNASLPHAVPGDRRLRVGSAVLIDWGARLGQYCSDLTRVIFIRRIPPRFRRMYENVRAAQAKAIEAIKPGQKMCDVDAVARQHLIDAGMGDRFSHGLGHGIGLDIHEQPRLAPKVTDRLLAGMVVTVEPGVYYPGFGGVRIEDDVLVTERGAEVLSQLSTDIAQMVIKPRRSKA